MCTRFSSLQILAIFAAALSGISSCGPAAGRKVYRIAFSQCVAGDQWRQTMLSEMERELSFRNDVDFRFVDAGGNSDRQVRQIDSLAKLGIDLLIVSPNEVKTLSGPIKKVYRSGIPVVVVDRRTNNKEYTAFVGADNFEVGQNAGRFAVSALKGSGNVMEVTGLPDASPVIDRHNGFMDIISRYPGVHFVKKIADFWTEKMVEDSIRKLGNIDLIFAQNDNMGLQMYHVCQRLGIEKRVKIIGVDGLPVKDMGLDMVAHHYIAATVLYPTGGKEAILTALNILGKSPYNKENQLFTTVIDSTNVRLMKMQADKLGSQQREIEKRQQLIDKQIAITRNQSTVIVIIACTMTLALLLAGASYYFLRENKKISLRLALQNTEISEQKDRIEEMSARAEEAHQARLNFFTNISHEFRTPLTLILSPLEDLMRSHRLPPAAAGTLQLVQKNVLRLYRLVNQLMDFRKIEFRKMHPRVTCNDLTEFVRDIVSSYEKLARNKAIHLQFHAAARMLNVWFDATMIDKVVFNLLSNAFKFTREDGTIAVTVTQQDEHALIIVEDDGIGMSAQTIQHAFEPFSQGEYENSKGTGLGLALSKELIELHQGRITVTSQKGTGTRFEVRLPLGKAHFQDDQVAADAGKAGNEELAAMYITELFDAGTPLLPGDPDHTRPGGMPSDSTILVVEDNDDLRGYLNSRLSAQYTIVEAPDANTALQQALDHIPDLVICDVMIPGKNGLELTALLKSDVRTAHIPVILLTARSEDIQKIEGLKTGADAYITKPFNVQYLEQTIVSLIRNRNKAKEHYTAEVVPEARSVASKKTDRRFISEFAAIVENNLANDELGVEQICAEMRVSRMQLYRKVRGLLQTSVNDYIIHARLQKAKYYLQHEDLSISEVAFKTGFSSANYFSTAFKSKFSVTPSEFKDKFFPRTLLR